MTYYVYITTNIHRNVLYIGVTNNLFKRMEKHVASEDKRAFTARYNVNNLLYFEKFDDVEKAIAREKQLKNWGREKKLHLIERSNPQFHFLQPDGRML